MKKILTNWYFFVIFGFIVFAGLVFAICGEDSIIAVHDNLDLFIPQYQMMKNTGTFWTQGDYVPFLGGISRDSLPSEFSLYTILYMILPSYPAYIAGYLLKILIALFSTVLLGKELYGEKYGKYKPLIFMIGFSYGILNMFPAFGIPFASIPLAIWLLLKIYRKPSWKWYALLFIYPLLSYFSYFGLFILAYMAVAFLWLWIKDKRFPFRILLAILVLSAGCIACEYRLFGLMLFSDEVTIRSTIVAGNMTGAEIAATIGDVFARGMFHAESMHTYLILPVCAVYFLYLNFSYIKQKNIRGLFSDLYNLLALILVFNSVVYGIYYWEGFRNAVETICPPLTGWQFNRTVFFSPFVWYAAFFLVLKRFYDSGRKYLLVSANLLALACALLIVFSNTGFNDLYHTCLNEAYKTVKGKSTDQLSFGEFYSTELFEKAKADIGYCGQWSAAYGFYPAVLEYNDIATLDGYLGFYAQSYKDEFRKVIAPALDRVEASRIYYDEWGARAYLYSGSDLSIDSTTKSYVVTDNDIYIDLDAFKALGGRYIFSRIELSNAEETGLLLVGTYTDDNSPYTLYVYQTTSRYQTRKAEETAYDEMKNLTFDGDLIEADAAELESLAARAEKTGAEQDPERVKVLYAELSQELTKLMTCYAIADITYYQDIYNTDSANEQQELTDKWLSMYDMVCSALHKVCSSPYATTMETLVGEAAVEALINYQDMTEREKEISLKENSLVQEYEQAAGEEYTFEYQGDAWTEQRLMEESDSLSKEDFIAIYQGLGKERNSVLGEDFLELLALRKETAEIYDYDNYAEYAYTEMYVRDYNLEEAEEFFADVKKKVVPVYEDMTDLRNEMDLTVLSEDMDSTGEELFTELLPYMEKIDSELAESLQHLLDYGMYDFSQSDKMADVGFTEQLPFYQDAFIMNKNDGTYMDQMTAIHEFGHYNQDYRNSEDLWKSQPNIDVGEIHSQGLEMLYYDYYDDLFGEDAGKVIAFSQAYRLIEVIVQTSLISEFEIEVYQHPNMSLEDMNKLYLNLSAKYGIYYVDEITELYSWTEVHHVFSQPCYCISYATSALSALDILTMSETDRKKAVESYMELTTLPTGIPYCSAVEFVGLRNVFDDGITEDIIQDTEEILQKSINQ